MNLDIISVDIESDGPHPISYNMVQLGAVYVFDFSNCFKGYLRPRNHENYDFRALNSFGATKEEIDEYPDPKKTMKEFAEWLSQFKRPYFLSDNAGFDWSFVNSYLHYYTGSNPFGHSCFSLTSAYKGLEKNLRANFRHLRDTKHTHDPLDDAKGNAEAFLKMNLK